MKETVDCLYCGAKNKMTLTHFEFYCVAECKSCDSVISAGSMEELRFTLGLDAGLDDDVDLDEDEEPILYEAGDK